MFVLLKPKDEMLQFLTKITLFSYENLRKPRTLWCVESTRAMQLEGLGFKFELITDVRCYFYPSSVTMLF